MAANFQQQHMGGPGQMMAQQQQQQAQQQQMAQQQQAQQQRPHAQAQIQAMIFNALNQQPQPMREWQKTVMIQERMSLIFNIIGNLRLIYRQQGMGDNLTKMIEVGMGFEKGIFEKATSKEQYKHEIAQKVAQLQERRSQNQPAMQQQIQQQAQQQAQLQQQQQAQAQMMMNQNSMQGQVPRSMAQQNNQHLQHLQHQMQASLLPGQTQQNPMGIANQGGAMPNMNGNQQFQMTMQMQQQMANRMQNNQGLTEQETQVADAMANKMLSTMSEDQKNNMRATIQARYEPGQLQNFASKGLDPLYAHVRLQASNRIRESKMNEMRQAQAQQLAQSQQNMAPGGTPMQQQRSVNPSPANGPNQPPLNLAGNGDMGFMENMENLVAQRRDGIAAAQAGQQVVPMSAPRNATPQPGGMINEQGGAPNANSRLQQQQQQQMFQQAQQQRLQQAAQQQQQNQAQARLNAQAKAQQMPLNGQPNGMGLNPMPPQQTPIMTTLNTPLNRTPSQQQMNPNEPPQISQNFGAQLDPRFNRQNVPPNINLAVLNQAMASLAPEHQMRLRQTPERLSDFVAQWQQRQNAQNALANMQAGRGQVQMQPNGQLRPGQPGPGGQFNPQNAGAQLMSGQGTPQSMIAGMNPQQQQQHQILQQQMAALGRQNQIPQQMNVVPPQMDIVEIPPTALHHAQMPQGIPPEIKQWGQLKSWVRANPNVAPNGIEVVWNLQRMHYHNILRNRQSQGQANIMQSGAQGPRSLPAGPQGIAAPVAPMGQMGMQMQMPNGMNMAMRPPTQQEIENVRRSGGQKVAGATDEAIRNFIMRGRQQQAMQAKQVQLNRMAAANGQQQIPQAGVPQLNPNAIGQQMPNQMPQRKPQPVPESIPPAPNANNANRPTRPPSAAPKPPQNSSPAPPANKLKRASSDDPIEVPNPNPPPRSAPQTAPGANQPQQPPRGGMPTQAQIASMTPEQRKKFEHAIRARQAAAMAQNATNAGNADLDKLKSFSNVEQEAESRRSQQIVPMDNATKAATAEKLKETAKHLLNVLKIIPPWFKITHDEQRARELFRVRCRVSSQFRDPGLNTLKDGFSITLREVEGYRGLLNKIVSDMKDWQAKQANAAKSHDSSATQPPAQVAPPAHTQGTTTPLSSANLKQQQQQLERNHQRTNSRSSHPPAAPTSSQAPFHFGAASPHGTPVYAPKPALTQENLHIPARKKQKQNTQTPVNAQGTPGSTSSPQIGKPAEIKKQPEPKQAKPALVCPEPSCDRHINGFENDEALRLHTQEEHVRPLENPLKYVQENLAAISGLDSQGRAKQPAGQSSEDAPTSVKMAPSGSRQGQTPNIKGENLSTAGTPMMRQVSMNRQGSAASHKPQGQAKTIKEELHTQKGQSKQGEQQPQQEMKPPVDLWANSTIDPHDLAQIFAPFATGAHGAISNIDAYRSITPNDTPESSKDGTSEPNSDISENAALDINVDFNDDWQPFGPSDADTLVDLNNFNFGGDDDLTMFDNNDVSMDAGFQQTWDDLVDASAFDKPFTLDTSSDMYSMNV